MAEGQNAIHPAETNAFGEKLKEIVLSAYTTLGMSFGLDLGLFDVMAEADDMLTAAEIAERASCKERYVKEWLDHMALSDIVNIDETGTKYLLPVHHREALTCRKSYIRIIGRVLPYVTIPHEEIICCARRDGPNGLPFSKVERQHIEIKKSVGQQSAKAVLDGMEQGIPGLVERLDSGISVCDVGCGRGHVTVECASRYPNSHVTGLDIYQPSVTAAETSARESNLTNVTFSVDDATRLPAEWTDKFDFIFMRFTLHDIPLATQAAAEVYRCLKPDGYFSVAECDIHTNKYTSLQLDEERERGRMMLPLSLYHCVPASMATAGSEALGACVGREALQGILIKVGFRIHSIKTHPGIDGLMLNAIKEIGL